MPYPEALPLAVVLAFHASERAQRGLAWLACALASATRMTGALLLLPLGYSYLRQTPLGTRRPTSHALLLPLTVLAAPACLYFRQVAGFLPPVDLVREHWHSVAGPPWQDFVNLFRLLVSGEITRKYLLDAAISIPFLFATIAGLRRMPVACSVYVASTLLLIDMIVEPMQPLVGLRRHVLVVFPGFINRGIRCEQRSLHRIITWRSAAALILLAGMFVMWLWVS